MTLRAFAPAKVNLTLEVGLRRADGMHPLQSAVMFADVGDWLEAADAGELSLIVAGRFAAALEGADNIVLRAAHALAAEAGIAPRAALRLEKNLPTGAGLGGGSSDAAAALRALNRHWSLDLDEPALQRIGRLVGADVPVCIAARSAWMTGDGDRLAPLAAPPLDAVLVNPLEPLGTAAVFAQFDRMGLGAGFAPAAAPRWPDAAAAIAGAARVGNHLAAPARALTPSIARIEAALAGQAGVRLIGLSGSGATVFALADSAAAAAEVAANLAAREPGWWIAPVVLGQLDGADCRP